VGAGAWLQGKGKYGSLGGYRGPSTRQKSKKTSGRKPQILVKKGEVGEVKIG